MPWSLDSLAGLENFGSLFCLSPVRLVIRRIPQTARCKLQVPGGFKAFLCWNTCPGNDPHCRSIHSHGLGRREICCNCLNMNASSESHGSMEPRLGTGATNSGELMLDICVG